MCSEAMLNFKVASLCNENPLTWRIMDPFQMAYILYTGDPNDPCFDWKRPSFWRQNKGQMSSGYVDKWLISGGGPNYLLTGLILQVASYKLG